MDTKQAPETEPAQARRVSVGAAAWWILGLGAAAFVLWNAERGPVSDGTRNPAGEGAPLPVTPYANGVDWVTVGEVAAAILFVGTVIYLVRGLRRDPRNPVTLMMAASCTLCWFDPINNWMIGLVYNPKMWHFPQDWPWVGMSPIIEPLTSFVYAPYITLPYFLAMPILRRLQRRRGRDAMVWRRPLVSLAALTFVIGFAWDALQEMFLVNTQFLMYTHVTPFGSIWVGENRQFPLLQASTLITIPMIAASLLLYREGDGPTVAETLARRFALFVRRPALSTFLVMTVVLNVCFIAFSTSFYLVRLSGAASSVACPWPYPTSKVWDPQGLYEANGHPGPFTAGSASGWLIGQPDGRPEGGEKKSDRCAE